ncbi:MAG TPA: DUF3006 domain-containing protein [Pyrinomonadaceae bacterium]|jgi:hypothetical protein
MPDDQAKRDASQTLRAVIDRIEDNDMAVLLVGDDEVSVDMPTALLPEGACDGDHLRITITLDKSSRTSAEERVKEMQERLSKRSDTAGKKEFKL